MNVEVVVVGLGNIGSHLVRHVARIDGIGRVTLVDRDVYETSNLRSQDVCAGDVGRPKARVQALRLRSINPELHTVAIADAVENVPAGILRGAIVLGCLDSRASRRSLAAAAWHVGARAYVDAGVEPDAGLVRLESYAGTGDAACFECSWDERDYAAQESLHPCDELKSAPASVPTAAPSSLGALAASLQAIECRKLLEGADDRALLGRRLVIDSSWHRHHVTTLRRNPKCRFDHRIWPLEPLPEGVTIAAALALGERDASLSVPGQPFVRQLTCARCHHRVETLRLAGRLGAAARSCEPCGAAMIAVGFEMRERLRARELTPAHLGLPLGSLGLAVGDVICVGGIAGERFFELVDRGRPAAARVA